MKIAFVHTDLRLYWPSRLSALEKHLNVAGHSLFVIEIAGKGSPYEFSLEKSFFSLNWKILFPDTRIEDLNSNVISKKLYKHLNELCPDIIIAGPLAFQSGAISTRWANINKIPIILFDDIRLVDIPRSWVVNKVKKLLFSTISAVIVPNKEKWLETYRYFGFSENQIFDGIDVVDNSFFNSGINNHKHPLISEKSILAIGRQIEKKNWAALLKAWIIQSNHEVRNSFNLIFIGDGPEHSSLVEMAETNQCKNVYFLPFQTQADLKQMYHSASAIVLPSKYGETWGLVVNEAMASGLPVLVSEQCGCASTLVEHGKNGFVFNPDSIDSIGNAILSLISLSEEDRFQMGQRSLEIIKDWDLDRFCNGVNEALDFASKNTKYKNTMGSILSRFWNGRYRPI